MARCVKPSAAAPAPSTVTAVETTLIGTAGNCPHAGSIERSAYDVAACPNHHLSRALDSRPKVAYCRTELACRSGLGQAPSSGKIVAAKGIRSSGYEVDYIVRIAAVAIFVSVAQWVVVEHIAIEI